jgi:hypothetical protein
MPDPAAQLAVSNVVELVVTICGFGGLGGLTYAGLTRLRAKVELLHSQNQKDHKRMTDELEKINGAGRKATDDITRLRARCNERHKDG